MKLVIGGCRGAYTTAGNTSSSYGGDTTSFLIQGQSGDPVLIDMGTGVRPLNGLLQADPGSRKLLVLMTHYHLDHLVGLPALLLLHDPRWSVTFAAPLLSGHCVEEVLNRLLAPPFSPLRMEDLAAHIDFITLMDSASSPVFSRGTLRIRRCPLQHPGGCSAYRIEEQEQSVVVATDMEWALSRPDQREALHSLCSQPRPADLLVMDGQYSRETYPGHEGWGHSTWEECVALAQQAGVKRLVITHHAPSDDDFTLDKKNASLQAHWQQARLARAGDVYDINAV
jgi:ribonuclease BN (tRNA processing enzyme)